MPNISDEAFNRHNPELTKAMAAVEKSMEHEMRNAIYGKGEDTVRPNRDNILYATPDNVQTMLNHARAVVDDLEYRRTLLLEERERIDNLIMDINYVIEVQRNVLHSAPPPAPTAGIAAAGNGRLSPSKAY